MQHLPNDAFGFDSLPHYSTHAVDFLEDVCRTLSMAGVPVNYERFIIGLLHAAVKFVLPESGYLFAEHDYEPKMFELQRLPYPVCAMEFRAGPELYAEGSGLHNSLKRIALCFDPHALTGEQQSRFESLIRSAMSKLPVRCLAITAVFSGENADWGAAVGFVLVDLDSDRPVLLSERSLLPGHSLDERLLSDLGGNRIQGTPSKHALPSTFLAIPERAELMGQSPGDALEALYIDTLDEVRTTYEFLAALNCSNVGAVDIAAPKKLNLKRAKTGKTQFFAYKILDLGLVTDASPSAGGSAGTSPRAHLRRGHIRRLGEKFGNRSLWINATIVNAHRPDELSMMYKIRPKTRVSRAP